MTHAAKNDHLMATQPRRSTGMSWLLSRRNPHDKPYNQQDHGAASLPFQTKRRLQSSALRKISSPGNRNCIVLGFFVVSCLFVSYFWMVSIFLRKIENHSNSNQHGNIKFGLEKETFWYKETTNSYTENKAVYVGMFGLGHRLSKLAAAYHFVRGQAGYQQMQQKQKSWPVTHLEVLWGSCDNTTDESGLDIFTYLFGNNKIHAGGLLSDSLDHKGITSSGTSTSLMDRYHQAKSIIIRNDVAGYYAGQVYKNARIPLLQLPLDLWQSKLDSDLVLFQYLLSSFDRQHGSTTVAPFQKQHDWDNYFVVGLHVRAGNGEREHFEQAQRQIHHETFYQNLVQTIRTFLESQANFLPSKPPLIFLATDTASVLEQLRHRFGSWDIPVVSVPQPRVAPKQGVSYSAWTAGSQHCWQGWLYSMVDMALLAKSNVVVAARRSTFTQILPLSIVLKDNQDSGGIISEQNKFRFCEASESGQSMTCFATRDTWLFRGHQNMVAQQYHHNQSLTKLHSVEALKTFGPENNSSAVVHKVMVHFPDPIFRYMHLDADENLSVGILAEDTSDEDLSWLQKSQQFLDTSQTSSRRMLFGFKIAKKYRRFKQLLSEWTMQNVPMQDPLFHKS
eukprot:CAMPEP_0198149082 /NCGR_PEP_ID=MMETSP1443-20131203/44991_1 /TAXON_ID=186043 /ORGANISM="Entomoneis sp., Strain CCMP2396" /LENGTH=617 /DNA_ID=CAMNT_0043814005 /DNA_START=98 /DNA_END=1951 /DNA_ORIENTATION=+